MTVWCCVYPSFASLLSVPQLSSLFSQSSWPLKQSLFFSFSLEAAKSLFNQWRVVAKANVMMRCFLPCFGASKRSKHLRSLNATPSEGGKTHVAKGAPEPQPASQLTQQKTVKEPIDCIAESKIKFEKQKSNESAEVEVTSTKQLIENLKRSREEEQEKSARKEETPQIGEKKNNHEEEEEEECSESLFSLSIGSRKQISAAEKTETEVNSPVQQLLGAVCTKKEESEAFGSSPPSVPEEVQLQHVSSVLNPLDQGKPSKATGVDSLKKEPKESTQLLVVKPEEQPICIAIRKVKNPNGEESSAEKIEENKEEKGKARPSKHFEYRYRDCSDDGYEDVNLDGSDLDVTFEGDDINGIWVQEESSESLFSLCTDSRKPISSAEKAENEVNSLMLKEEETEGRLADVSSVLNPIKNVTTRGRVGKTTVLKSQKNDDKENINISAVQDVGIPLSPEPSLKLSKRKARQKLNDKEEEEIGVDTSLSSWLVEPEATPISTKSNSSVGERTPKGGRRSPWSNEDRPILGALTLEEIRKYSLSTSSRKTRSRSPDETPIIGTVGSYWSHTGQTLDSNSSRSEKDAEVKSGSSTLKTRLERAFEASVCEV